MLVVLAHQDDEIALGARILLETRAGATVYCVFLTDGSRQGTPSAREAESRIVLARLGVPERNIFSIGSLAGISDGQLVDQLDLALERLRASLDGVTVDAIYCLAWEGGHHDHDASHLVALAYAAPLNLLRSTWGAPLYNGHRRFGSLYRVMSPLPDGEWQSRKITCRDAVLLLRLTRVYRSQRKTWTALLPGAFVKLLLRGRESLQRVDAARVSRRPHDGALYYERRFKVPYERFVAAARPFIERHLRGSYTAPSS